MRIALSLTAVLLSSSAALADDILVRVDISDATVYAQGAEVTRSGAVTIPAGEHRLLIPAADAQWAGLFEVDGPDGVTFGPPQFLGRTIVEEGIFDNPAEAEARALVEAARDAVQAAQDAIVRADADIRAIEAALAYLSALTRGGPDGVAMPEDPSLVPQFLATLRDETARAQTDLQAAHVSRRALAEELTDRQAELSRASEAFTRLRPFGTTVEMVEVSLRADTEVSGDVALSYLTNEARWAPIYDLRLDSETGDLGVERSISVYVPQTARWTDVAVTFSTSMPHRMREPSAVFPTPARIVEPSPTRAPAGGLVSRESEMETFAAAAPVLVVEDAARASMDVQGLSVRYVYADPVTIGSTGQTTLPFDGLSFEAETEARAVPRRDATAFLIAMTENDSGEPILPGQARFYRDGALVGDGQMPLIPTGAEIEMAFGPLDHLQLTWIDRSLAEGDTGLFVTSNTQAREIAFGVENTSAETETVRLYYATPFAEQEDLELDIRLSPAPDTRDVDDMRGVHVWDVSVEPGATELVEMQVEFSWPDGQILNWRP